MAETKKAKFTYGYKILDRNFRDQAGRTYRTYSRHTNTRERPPITYSRFQEHAYAYIDGLEPPFRYIFVEVPTGAENPESFGIGPEFDLNHGTPVTVMELRCVQWFECIKIDGITDKFQIALICRDASIHGIPSIVRQALDKDIYIPASDIVDVLIRNKNHPRRLRNYRDVLAVLAEYGKFDYKDSVNYITEHGEPWALTAVLAWCKGKMY
jgi:hypothetical protein